VRALTAVFALTALGSAGAQTKADPALLAAIQQIRAIDNHAHPARLLAPGESSDPDVDALISGFSPDFGNYPPPLRLQPDCPDNFDGWHALFGYPWRDIRPEHMKQLMRAKEKVRAAHGDDYPSWVLDQLGIETMLANRVAMGRGLKAPRFLWVSFVDALLFPLDNTTAKNKNPDEKWFFGDEERLLQRYLKEAGLQRPPAAFNDYLRNVVTATLERQREHGAVAIKFEAAYLRTLDFADATEADARGVYEKYAGGGEPSPAEYKTLQDFLFRYMAREAGRLGMAVHFHVAGGGAGTYYDAPGGNPMLLTSAFNDPTLRHTNFVIVHGGEPWVRETRDLFQKPNVYADFSAQTFLDFPRELSQTIRSWIEWYPDKVLFGTDTSPASPEFGWEEQGWITTRTARQALALALTGMVDDGEVTREKALVIAKMVLHDNAAKLYGLPALKP